MEIEDNMSGLTIGDVRLKNKLFLAPMVDVSDLSFRLLCRREGAAIAYTEMLQAEALIRGGEAIKLKTLTNKEDNPLGIQVTGKRISDFRKVGGLEKYSLVDLNCGCPGHLTIVHGSGSYLMKSPEKIGSIIRVLKDRGLTTTAKIRLGYKHNDVMKIAKEIERTGADALTLHPRLASQGRGGEAEWKYFAKIKKKIGIPLIGNGDIDCGEDAATVLDDCDGIMIARASIGNPRIFGDILHYLKTGRERKLNYKKNLKLYLEYIENAEKYGLLKMSKVKYIGGKFLRGFEGAPQVRNKFMRLGSYAEIKDFIQELI